MRSQTLGMVQPDGAHAINNLAKRKRFAFERYQQALNHLTSELLSTRPAAADVHPPASHALVPVPPPPKPLVRQPQLTGREVEVLDRIAQGLTSKEIARELNISFKTAVTHRTHLMSKFDSSNVALLIRRAIASGHIKP